MRGHLENKNRKIITKQLVWWIFLSPTLKENVSKHCNGFSIFWLAFYIVRLFDSHFSMLYFSLLNTHEPAKFSILVCKRHHSAKQSDDNKINILPTLLSIDQACFVSCRFLFLHCIQIKVFIPQIASKTHKKYMFKHPWQYEPNQLYYASQQFIFAR